MFDKQGAFIHKFFFILGVFIITYGITRASIFMWEFVITTVIEEQVKGECLIKNGDKDV